MNKGDWVGVITVWLLIVIFFLTGGIILTIWATETNIWEKEQQSERTTQLQTLTNR